MQQIYLDTNVYIDLWEDRADNIRPLGEFAFQLFRKVYECKFVVILSSLVIDELEFNFANETIKEMLKELKSSGKYKYYKVTEEDRQKAKESVAKDGTEFNDTLHAIMANKTGAVKLVTNNLKDFEKLGYLLEAISPADLLGSFSSVG